MACTNGSTKTLRLRSAKGDDGSKSLRIFPGKLNPYTSNARCLLAPAKELLLPEIGHTRRTRMFDEQIHEIR